jgi:cell division protein FtsA
VLTDEEGELGVMLIDIGGGTTDVMVFIEGGVTASGVIGLGGNNVTSDIAYGLRTPQKFAEELKIKRGCALSTMVPEGETIEVPGIGLREKRKVGRMLLAGIIEPRMKELFSLIDQQIARNEFKKSLGAGVVLTGGCSLLEGARELAEQIFDLPVRVGSPLGVEGLVEVASHPMYATGVGLLLYVDEVGRRWRDKRSFGGLWRNSLSQIKRAIASYI